MRISNVFNLGVKELRSLMRDPMMLGLIVFAFSFAIYTAATALPETLNRAAIAIFDEDRSPLSTRITTAFYPPHFLLPQDITATEMDARMDAGLDTFALNIPPNFQRDVLAGRSPAIQLNVDATRMSQAFTGSGYIQTIVTMKREHSSSGIAPRRRRPSTSFCGRASTRNSTEAGSAASWRSSTTSRCCPWC